MANTQNGGEVMKKSTVHVMPDNSSAMWSVKRSGAQHASIRTETKQEAVKVGRIMSQRSGSELVIHGADGRIQHANTIVMNTCHSDRGK